MHMQDQRSWKCAKRLTFAAFLTVFSFNLPVIGQGQMPEHSHSQQQNKPEQKQEQTQPEQQMPGKEHGQHKGMPMHEHATMQAGHRAAAEPASTPVPMLTTMRGKWMLMLHGVAFLNSLQQSGPRGADKVFSNNWVMPMAHRELGPGSLTLRAMLSLEPATVTNRRYPELFQTGETAFGKPIVDGQHPHDFFMEIAVLYDWKVGESTTVSFYGAPMGDPSLGPTAFPHRMSASENPMAPLGHHLQDSTHIATDVLTVGINHKVVRLEASGFHGREPDEHRWDIDSGKIDSWATRLTISPTQNWAGQYSISRLNSPENQEPDEDILRMTASVTYNRPITAGNWATSLIWGRNRTMPDDEIFNGYTFESTLRFMTRNYVWGRLENTDRTNELQLGEKVPSPGFREHFFARVQEYSLGYDHDFDLIPHLVTALGAQVNWYGIPDKLRPIYGNHPVGTVVFLRVRPFGDSR